MQKKKSVSIIARTVIAFTCGPISTGKLAIVALTLLVYQSTIIAKAESCPTAKDEIITDRPDVTNSSLVVPAGSLQIENGVNFSARDGGRFVDGTNTRLRAGIANCLEVLVDVPTYFANVRRCRPGAEVADQPYPGKNRSFRGVWCGIADRLRRHSRPRRTALCAIPVVVGIAQRMGIEWNVHRIHSSLRADQQVDHGSHFCNRKEGDGEGELVCGIRRRLPGEWKSCSTAEFGRRVSPHSDSTGGLSCGRGAQPQRAQLHCRRRIFSAFR